ncbi:MAG: fimbrillin family protein [Prevotella sp.]|nr:fimbrillin family protein [Prevotella sp.]
MMRYIYILLFATLVACSKESVEENASSDVIKFKTPTFQKLSSATRASVFTSIDDLQKDATDIRVTAKYHNDHSKVYIDSERLKYESGAWTINKYFWIPNQYLDFFAEVVAGNGDRTYFSKVNPTNYTFDYTVPTDITKQYDYIYAVCLNKYKEDIPLEFRHALSQIVFTASVAENWDVMVNKITIVNVHSAGTFSYETQGWTTTDEATNSYVFQLGTPKVFNGTSAAVRLQTENDERLLQMPQTLNPWVLDPTPETITQANENKHSYIIINCKIRNIDKNTYYAGDANTYGNIYAAIDGTWESNKLYTYELAFGAGYKDSGEQTIQLITLSAKIDDWVAGESKDGTTKFE